MKYVVLLLAIAMISSVATASVGTAQADRDTKSKEWIGDAGPVQDICNKDDNFDNCKGQNVNKVAKETCESLADGKCKQIQIRDIDDPDEQ